MSSEKARGLIKIAHWLLLALIIKHRVKKLAALRRSIDEARTLLDAPSAKELCGTCSFTITTIEETAAMIVRNLYCHVRIEGEK